MSLAAAAEQHFTYEARLASFQLVLSSSGKRVSMGSAKGKVTGWPHKKLSPADFAKAGFLFYPLPNAPDNVMCFLCHKCMDGWEETDNPWLEHLSHTGGSCAWAVCSAIEADVGDLRDEDPTQAKMLQARKATFAGRWPHEGKKGWKCKTKQLAEAGWSFTPSAVSEDMVTCNYCHLALDGWEQGDKPLTEHADRVPDCVFFTRQTAGGKRAAKAKAPRLSKASRLSAQSVMTIGESVADLPAEYDDSVMTTASTLTQGGKKATRAKKAAATTAKGRKTRAKKDDVVEILEDDEVDATAETIAPPPPPKTARGRKRKSDAMDESVATIAEAPAPKKRATKQRGSAAVDASVDDMTLSQDVDVTEAGAKPAKRIAAGRKKATATKAGKGRTSATSNTSVMSHDAPAITMMADLPDEEELNRQLEADFDRPLSDVEDLAADSDSERRRRSRSSGSSEPPKKGRGVEVQPHGKSSSGDFAMFDPTPVEADEAAVDAELRALEAEMAASEQPETLHVPKKGARKLPAAPRKVSKQTAARRAKAALAKAKAEEEGQAAAEAEAVEEPAADAAAPTIKKGRPRKKTASGGSEETAPVETERGNGNIKTARPDTSSPARPLPALPGTPPRRSSGGRSHGQQQRAAEPAEVAAAVANTAPQHPSPPAAAAIIATPSAKQAQLSPSASPQSSDAENMPPSSSQAAASSAARRISGGGGGPGGRVAAAVAAAEAQRHPAPPAAAQAKEGKRVALAPAATPVRPARTRNAQYTAQTPGGMVGGLRSTTPWTAADLDAVFLREDDGEGRDGESPEAEDDEEEEEDEFLRMLRRAQRGQQAGAGRPAGRAAVTSPERGMTVEQWIYHNAGLAEKRLRQECEAVVTAFEREGGRAMTALEAVVVAE